MEFELAYRAATALSPPNITAAQQTALTFSRATSVLEGIIWIVLCVAWQIYHFRLNQKHPGLANKSTRPVSFFLACEAVSKGGVLVIFFLDSGVLTPGLAIGLLVTMFAAFVGLAFCTLFAAIGYGVVRDYDAATKWWISKALTVVFLGPFAVVAASTVLAIKFAIGSDVSFVTVIVLLSLVIFFGMLACFGFYGFVFYKLSTETLQMIPNSSLSHIQQQNFGRRFAVLRLMGMGLMVILVLTLPTYLLLYFVAAPPIVSPIISFFTSAAVVAFGIIMAWVYMLRADEFHSRHVVVNEMDHVDSYSDNY